MFKKGIGFWIKLNLVLYIVLLVATTGFSWYKIAFKGDQNRVYTALPPATPLYEKPWGNLPVWTTTGVVVAEQIQFRYDTMGNHDLAWQATSMAVSYKVCPVFSLSPADQTFFSIGYQGPARWKSHLPPCFWVNDPGGKLMLVTGVAAIKALFGEHGFNPNAQSQISLQPPFGVPGLVPQAAVAAVVLLIVLNIVWGFLSLRSNTGRMTEQYA